jgi:hypothetical protein
MNIKLLWVVAILWLCTYPASSSLNDETRLAQPVDEVNQLLSTAEPTLRPEVIHQVLTALKCASLHKVEHNPVLTIIDYSLPASEKRLWVFDLSSKKMLFHTYVSHGIKSGALLSTYFSNQYDSKTSSIGVYKTEKAYYGREGLSLKLEGLEKGFNDHAFNRSIVMHGGWYLDEGFIKKYGRGGRSWGCPAVPLHLSQSIINTIKDNSLFIVYYPSEPWLQTSSFLHCESPSTRPTQQASTELVKVEDKRDPVFLVSLHQNKKNEENEAILVTPAEHYEDYFHEPAPLNRMLRRQINQREYIALSVNELNQMKPEIMDEVYFVVPSIKMHRGYYVTEMNLVNLGKIKTITPEADHYTVSFNEAPTVTLRKSDQFIRWLGL